jgi:hypothetical protein
VFSHRDGHEVGQVSRAKKATISTIFLFYFLNKLHSSYRTSIKMSQQIEGEGIFIYSFYSNQEEEPNYFPKIEELFKYINVREQKAIQNVCEFYWLSYQNIPYDVPKSCHDIKNTLEFIKMFTTILER